MIVFEVSDDRFDCTSSVHPFSVLTFLISITITGTDSIGLNNLGQSDADLSFITAIDQATAE